MATAIRRSSQIIQREEDETGNLMDKKKKWSAGKWLKESISEFNKYKKTGKGIKLAQAGEKLWNSYTLYLDKKHGKELTSYKDIRDISIKDPFTKKIFDDVYWLHIFFYRGYTDDLRIEEGKFKSARDNLKKVI
jgi:hypothetical protein